MRSFLKIIVFSVFVSVSSSLTAQITVKPKLGEPPLKAEKFIYIDEKTPDYIIKNDFLKNTGFAFELKDDGDWLKRNIETITRNGVIVFINSDISKQQRKYIDELAKLTGYNLKIICYKGNCESEQKWKHPLIKTTYFFKWKKNKDGEDVFFYGTGQKSKGEIQSVTALNNFRKEPFIKSAVFFRDHRFGFVLIDEEERPFFIKDADIVIYFSKSEKKLKEFIEKKN
ncbi:MAG TPA: hypothetical protein PLD55_14300 [bacterium]|jgi:hypothetical protein|nr:hypothetical protein [bacterium]MDX9806511.1 hypothetical protein [bacterium]HNW15916.1 hypothetical protein [bacterium]HOB71880.1 hypothetical protein [bacterium]HOG44482.1 hypothetical protein [bacterium]